MKYIISMAMVIFLIAQPLFADAEGVEDAKYFEVSTSEIKDLGVNHEQGSISFIVDDVQYFYYVEGDEKWKQILASRELQQAIIQASFVQVKHVAYGLHRKIVNLLLFYGDHKIPNELKTNQ